MPQSSNLVLFCPRCGGSLRRESDLYGEYDWCLNCGYHGDVLIGPPIGLKPTYMGGLKPKIRRGQSRGGRKL